MDKLNKFEEALQRLALPLAFGVPNMADPECQARMVYAQAVLDGDTLDDAEDKAAARATEALNFVGERAMRGKQ